jgi:lipoprotein-anchoring transpeptidase ErfK/SrfK
VLPRRKHAFGSLVRAAAVVFGMADAWSPAQTIAYKLERSEPLSRFSPDQIALLAKLNHADSAHLGRLRLILIPDRWDADELLYTPMPKVVPQLSQEKKAIAVDLAAQMFGAYEFGRLVRWGPVSSGSRQHRTPPGTYHLNWRARVHVSSENPTWVMQWYFNFASGRGLALHQYALPGKPASHGCVRMLAVDAKWLYHWGDGWTLAAGTHEVTHPGTLVILLGSYDFTSPQPWLQPQWWTRSVSLPAEQIATRK